MISRSRIHSAIIESIFNFFFSWDLAKIPNMEIALGCITTIFGSRAAQRIAILMNLYGLKLNQDKVLQASIFLKPKARMISLRYVSKYHKFCIEDSTEGELFFDVKKLMTRGDLTPILFGSKVNFPSIWVNVFIHFGNIFAKWIKILTRGVD